MNLLKKIYIYFLYIVYVNRFNCKLYNLVQILVFMFQKKNVFILYYYYIFNLDKLYYLVLVVVQINLIWGKFFKMVIFKKVILFNKIVELEFYI